MNQAILDWKTNKHIGTNLDTWEAAGLLGSHHALLMAAWGTCLGVFAFIAALLWGYGMDDIVLRVIFYMAGGAVLGGIVGLVYGMVKAAVCHEAGDHDIALMCQSALKIDPPSASKIDPPQVVVFSSLYGS